MDLKGCEVVRVEAGHPRQKEQPGKVSMFCSSLGGSDSGVGDWTLPVFLNRGTAGV